MTSVHVVWSLRISKNFTWGHRDNHWTSGTVRLWAQVGTGDLCRVRTCKWNTARHPSEDQGHLCQVCLCDDFRVLGQSDLWSWVQLGAGQIMCSLFCVKLPLSQFINSSSQSWKTFRMQKWFECPWPGPSRLSDELISVTSCSFAARAWPEKLTSWVLSLKRQIDTESESKSCLSTQLDFKVAAARSIAACTSTNQQRNVLGFNHLGRFAQKTEVIAKTPTKSTDPIWVLKHDAEQWVHSPQAWAYAVAFSAVVGQDWLSYQLPICHQCILDHMALEVTLQACLKCLGSVFLPTRLLCHIIPMSGKTSSDCCWVLQGKASSLSCAIQTISCQHGQHVSAWSACISMISMCDDCLKPVGLCRNWWLRLAILSNFPQKPAALPHMWNTPKWIETMKWKTLKTNAHAALNPIAKCPPLPEFRTLLWLTC